MSQDNSSDLNPTDKFFRYFQRELAEISQNIEKLGHPEPSDGEHGNSFDQCQASITRLSNEVRQASSYITAHDRRIYSEAIKGLQQKLKEAQAAVAPKPKFSFKSGRTSFAARKTSFPVANLAQGGQPQPTNLDPSNGLNTGARHSDLAALACEQSYVSETTQKNRPNDGLDQSQQLSSAQKDSVVLSNRTGEHINLSSSVSSANLTTLRRCVVDLNASTTTSKSFASLTLKNIQESLIFCGQVNGPIFLTDITNSVIVLSSRQFRMHESQNCDIYLLTTSRPIIENCSTIRFAPLPDIYKTGADEQTENQWQQVDDFNWHRSEPSPHWSILEASQQVTPDAWRSIVSSEQSIEVEDILDAVNLPK